MKYITTLLALLFASAITCLAGSTTQNTLEPLKYETTECNWLASPFVSYFNPQGGGDNDGIGGGVLIEKYLDNNFGIGASLEGNSGPSNQFAALASTSYLFTACPFVTPYITASAGYQHLGESGALVRTGAGFQAELTESITAFTDWQYGWDSNGGEQQIVRLGLSFQF